MDHGFLAVAYSRRFVTPSPSGSARSLVSAVLVRALVEKRSASQLCQGVLGVIAARAVLSASVALLGLRRRRLKALVCVWVLFGRKVMVVTLLVSPAAKDRVPRVAEWSLPARGVAV